MDEITIYEKPTCSKCRAAIGLLDQNGVPYQKVRYHDAPLTKKKLGSLIRKLGITPRELLRTEDPAYRALALKPDMLSDDAVIALMLEHPDLIQRPILERGDRAIIGRPTERVTAFLKEA